jgi:hypothetical protein
MGNLSLIKKDWIYIQSFFNAITQILTIYKYIWQILKISIVESILFLEIFSMKKLSVLILMFFVSLSQAQAGLFEYHMNGSLKWFTQSDAPDIIETLEVQPTYSYDLNKTWGYLNTYWLYRNTNSYSQSYKTVQQNIFANDYYKSQTNNFQNDFTRLKSEKQFLVKQEAALNVQLINISWKNTNYYRDLRYQLNQERDYVVARQKQLQKIMDDIEYQSNRNYNSSYYYNTQWTRIYSASETTLYNNNPRLCYSYSEYNEYRYQDSSYTQNCYGTKYVDYSQTPSWVNPDLQDVKNGRIYIK